MTLRVLALPGDGVGPEVTEQALRVLEWFRSRRGLDIAIETRPFGMASWHEHGALMPDGTWDAIGGADAILFGAIGGLDLAAIPAEERRRGGLLRIRKALDLYANLRPVRMQPALAESSPFKPRTVLGTDLVIVRELTGGIYFGTPRGVEGDPGERRGINTHSYTEAEIIRIARFAFELARRRRNHVTSVDKANVMESGALWRQVVTDVHRAGFADVTLDHMHADNCALQLGIQPTRFDVILTDNLFGDVLSDGAGAVLGSLGMLPSASLGPLGPDGRRRALFEPVHGSAPDIAGKAIANPLGAILSVAMLLRWSARSPEEANRLNGAVAAALASGARTADICAPGEAALSTSGMGAAVLAALEAGG